MNRRPTIIDVAKKAGVSKSTVSLVLRNSPTIRDETRKAVRKAMSEIGYVYNRSAANMRSSNAGLVGLVINDLRNPFFTEFATSFQMALAEKGYATVIANTDEDAALQEQVVSSMIEHGVSALIVSSAYGDSKATFDMIERAGVPTLQMLRKVDDRLDLFPLIAPDYTPGGAAATKHLIETGARRIAFVGGLEGRSVTQERMTGYLDVLKEAGIEPLVLTGKTTRDYGRDMAKKLAADFPDVDAALCFNDLVAIGMLSGFQESGRKVGQDFRIVGFDDIEEAGQTYPTLSSVSFGIASIGAQAAATTVKWLEDGDVPVSESRMPVHLTIRQSSAGCGEGSGLSPKSVST